MLERTRFAAEVIPTKLMAHGPPDSPRHSLSLISFVWLDAAASQRGQVQALLVLSYPDDGPQPFHSIRIIFSGLLSGIVSSGTRAFSYLFNSSQYNTIAINLGNGKRDVRCVYLHLRENYHKGHS
jgi:hypothetical protein